MALFRILNRLANTNFKTHCFTSIQKRFIESSVFRAARYNRLEARDVNVKSSKPLKDGDDTRIFSKKPSKPRQYIVFGNVSVDEETFNKLQMEDSSEDDDIDEGDLQNILQNSEHYYDMYKREEQMHRSYIRHKTLEQKIFTRKIEPSLLTWGAREQIRYLNTLDPDKWIPEEISKHFPVSVLGAKKLLRSTFKYCSKEKIKKYDESVRRNWKKVSQGAIDNLDENLQELWFSRKLKPNQALPNPSLPLPPPRDANPSPFLLDSTNKSVGEFYSLVKPYIDFLQKTQQLQIDPPPVETVEEFSHDTVARCEEDESDARFPCKSLLDDEIEDPSDRKQKQMMRKINHVTHEQFQVNMKEELKSNRSESEYEGQMLEWLENQQPLLETSHNKSSSMEKTRLNSFSVPKYRKNVDVKYDTPKGEKNIKPKEAYIYSASTGYQHPFGKHDISKDHIKINPKMEKGLYKVRDSFYSEDGELVYRVFTK